MFGKGRGSFMSGKGAGGKGKGKQMTESKGKGKHVTESKGKGKHMTESKGKGKHMTAKPGKGKAEFMDFSKGKGKADVDSAFWKGKGKGYLLSFKHLLDAVPHIESPYTSIPKGGPPMQQIFAFDVSGSKTGGTDVFFSHQYVKPEDTKRLLSTGRGKGLDSRKGVEFYELWWTPLPKAQWWATKPHEWAYMGRCVYQEGETFKPLIWGVYGQAIRTLRGVSP